MTTTHNSNSIPEGYNTVTPWIISSDSSKLIGFMKQAFNAKEKGDIVYNDDWAVAHAEALIGDSVVMLFDSYPNWPKTPGFVRLYVKDADKIYNQAIDAGARSVTKVTELFWGDRIGRVCDPFGNIWWIQSILSGLSYQDIQLRSKDPFMIKAMEYVQQSLIDELKCGND
jgi:uncharacterized glyoxalase superfamily protein PhnB